MCRHRFGGAGQATRRSATRAHRAAGELGRGLGLGLGLGLGRGVGRGLGLGSGLGLGLGLAARGLAPLLGLNEPLVADIS